MRVLLVNSEGGFRGGEHQTVLLALGLRDRGCEVSMCVRAGSPIAERVAGIVPYDEAPFETVPMITPFVLRRCITRWRPQILHAQTSRAHTHLWTARILVPHAPPLVVSRRVAFPVSRGVAGRIKYRTGVARFIPISAAAAQTLRDAGVCEDRITIVPSGIPVGRFAAASGDRSLLDEWGIDGDRFVIGTVASFEAEKGYAVLLGAAKIVLARCPACRFVWLARGGGGEWLRAAVAREGLSGTVAVARLDAPLETVLPLFSLFALPSLREGLSTALLAALAAGVPVVASETGGIPEVLRGGCGRLVAAGDSNGLAAAIMELEGDARAREALRARGRERARDYDSETMIEGTLAVYRRVLGVGNFRCV